MQYKNTRLVLVLLFIVIGIVLHVKLGIGSAWYLYVAALLLLATHFLFGNVWAAFGLMKKGHIEKAESMMDQIKRPDFLLKSHQAYYHFIKGIAALQNKEFPEAEEHLTGALQRGLRTVNDEALVTLNLAHLCFAQNRKEEAAAYLKKVKALSYNDLMLKDKVAEMEKALAR
ncbi:MAG: tetratricopeptide repeat protein [Saprospiraceae bacterium]